MNGDVDLKHLFWKSDAAQLLVIDWGNSQHEINDPLKYAFDIARVAEITFTLLTLQPFPSDLKTPLTKIFPLDTPEVFQDLCNWAPRLKPLIEKAPWSANDLLKVAQKWKTDIKNSFSELLGSERMSDVWRGMEQAKASLETDLDDRAVYGILLEAAQNHIQLRDRIRNLFLEMKAKGSSYAETALSRLPSQDILLADADDAYYAGNYDQAISLYQQVLQQQPDNHRAQQQLDKAELNRFSGKPSANVPREAIRYYRAARSYIAARDFATASVYLKAAIEAAAEKGVEFKEAQDALESIQTITIAQEYEQKALTATNAQEWAKAAINFEKAIQVYPEFKTAKLLLDQLENLLIAQSLIEQLHAGISDRNRIVETINQVRDVIKRTGTTPELSELWQQVVRRFGEYKTNHNKTSSVVRYIAWSSVASIAIILLILWYLFLFPRSQILLSCDQSIHGLSAALDYPSYIANGDVGKIQITLSNSSNTSITGTALVDFQGTAKVQIVDPVNTNSIPFDLNHNEIKSATIFFSTNEPIRLISDPSKYINFYILTSGNSTPCAPQNIHIAMSPIWGLNKLIVFLWGTVGLAIVGLFWERIKELIKFKK